MVTKKVANVNKNIKGCGKAKKTLKKILIGQISVATYIEVAVV
jgi:hypothetical protein